MTNGLRHTTVLDNKEIGVYSVALSKIVSPEKDSLGRSFYGVIMFGPALAGFERPVSFLAFASGEPALHEMKRIYYSLRNPADVFQMSRSGGNVEFKAKPLGVRWARETMQILAENAGQGPMSGGVV